MKIFLTFLLSLSLLSAVSVDKKIKQKTKQLSAKKIEYKKMDKQLSSVAKKIIQAKKDQKSLNNKLIMLEKNIKDNEAEYSFLKKEDDVLIKSLNNVSKSIDLNQSKFVELVSKKFSMALALEELHQPTAESVMMQEVYEVYAKKNNEQIEILKNDITILKKKKSRLSRKELKIQETIDTYVEQRQEYKNKKAKKDKIIVELARDKAIYKKRFNSIKSSRRLLEKKLASLKIVKHDAKVAAARKRARDAQRRENARVAKAELARQNNKPIPKTKKVKKTKSVPLPAPKVAKYSGGKTISPLKGARLIKKFGTYIDPIYKFKIFNKSVTLKAPHAGSKVKSVLAGKIVFAENSGGMLGKVVIVEHANKIHTIYAKLSRLAPGIHVGKQLSRGSIIGKVDKSLMFEVTKNNKHMNPLKLIRL